MASDRRRVSRAEVLDAAATVLDARDNRMLTVDALARLLKMSKSTLYKHFSTKEALVLAVVEQRCVATESDLAAAGSAMSLAVLAGVVADFCEGMPRAVLIDRDRIPGSALQRLEATFAAIGVACRGAVASHPTWSPLVATVWLAAAREAAMAAARGEVVDSRSQAVWTAHAIVFRGIAETD